MHILLGWNEILQPQKDLSKIFLIAADVKKQNKYTEATTDKHNFSKIIIKEIENIQSWQ